MSSLVCRLEPPCVVLCQVYDTSSTIVAVHVHNCVPPCCSRARLGGHGAVVLLHHCCQYGHGLTVCAVILLLAGVLAVYVQQLAESCAVPLAGPVVMCAVCCGIRGPPISQLAAVVEAYLLLRASMLRLYEIISGNLSRWQLSVHTAGNPEAQKCISSCTTPA